MMRVCVCALGERERVCALGERVCVCVCVCVCGFLSDTFSICSESGRPCEEMKGV